jgi:hypothetical protein
MKVVEKVNNFINFIADFLEVIFLVRFFRNKKTLIFYVFYLGSFLFFLMSFLSNNMIPPGRFVENKNLLYKIKGEIYFLPFTVRNSPIRYIITVQNKEGEIFANKDYDWPCSTISTQDYQLLAKNNLTKFPVEILIYNDIIYQISTVLDNQKTIVNTVFSACKVPIIFSKIEQAKKNYSTFFKGQFFFMVILMGIWVFMKNVSLEKIEYFKKRIILMTCISICLLFAEIFFNYTIF